MGFLRVVEVFPPLIASSKDAPRVRRNVLEEWLSSMEGLQGHADLVMVANLKDPEFIKMDTVEASILLKERLGVETAPVLVVRDVNRPQLLSSVFTCLTMGVGACMVAWGDDYPKWSGFENVRDFSNLSSAIKASRRVASRTKSPLRLFAPINLADLGGKETRRAKRRLKAGAELLLAQPPTTDAGDAFNNHSSTVARAGLDGRVVLSVFPFRDKDDIDDCKERFGWKFPKRIVNAAKSGPEALLAEERAVVRRIRDEGFPGIYLSTRGDPGWAERLLS